MSTLYTLACKNDNKLLIEVYYSLLYCAKLCHGVVKLSPIKRIRARALDSRKKSVSRRRSEMCSVKWFQIETRKSCFFFNFGRLVRSLLARLQHMMICVLFNGSSKTPPIEMSDRHFFVFFGSQSQSWWPIFFAYIFELTRDDDDAEFHRDRFSSSIFNTKILWCQK